MALISCPECQRQVSDQAATCPSCGFAIAGAAAPGLPAGDALAAAALRASGSGAPHEAVTWEGRPSVRLIAREAPGIIWALAAPIFGIILLPDAMKVVGALNDEFKKVIAQQGGTLRTVVLGGIVLVSLLRLGRAGLRFARLRSTHYRVTNQRLTIDSGLISKRVDDVDLRSIDDVSLEQSPLERLLGVARLGIVSTDRARPRLELYGIESPREVRERVRSSVYQATQRQVFTRST